MSFMRRFSNSSLITVLLLPIIFSTPALANGFAHEAAAPSAHLIEVPFYYQEKDYYCGPAALQMVFDFYGENVSQDEIADVARTAPYVTYTDELRRAAHFSNASSSGGSEMTENITGYTLRKLGYAAFEAGGMTLDDLKSLIDQDFPIILLMSWIYGEQYGHYKVAVGYNDTCIFLHDPWNPAWGYTEYGGPYTAMNHTFFLSMWSYSGNWGLFVSPWKVTINTAEAVRTDSYFLIAANISYVCPSPFSPYPYPASSCNASIAFPANLTLAEGENVTLNIENLQAGTSTQAFWVVEAAQPGNYSITVQAEGTVTGYVGEEPESGPSYEYKDIIGGSATTYVAAGNASQIYIRGIYPPQAAPETKVSLFGGNATPGGAVEGLFGGLFNQTIYFGNDSVPIITIGTGNVSLGVCYADADGYWELIFNVPQVSAGNYSIYAFDNETLTSDAIGFGVLPGQPQIRIAYVSAYSGLANTTIYVSGDGATANSEVRLYFSGSSVANTTALQEGQWTASFSVPNVAAGNYIITAVDAASSTRDTATFTMTAPPTIHVFPQEAPVGSKITVTGEGFTGNTGIYIAFEDMLLLSPIFINEDGAFNTTIFVPAINSGNCTIKIIGAYYTQLGLSTLAQTNFTVTAGLDTLFQTIDDIKQALNQTQNTAQTALDEASRATEAAKAAEAQASEAKTYALIAMISIIVTLILSAAYFTTIYTCLEKTKPKKQTT
jgi:hypothetical protein